MVFRSRKKKTRELDPKKKEHWTFYIAVSLWIPIISFFSKYEIKFFFNDVKFFIRWRKWVSLLKCGSVLRSVKNVTLWCLQGKSYRNFNRVWVSLIFYYVYERNKVLTKCFKIGWKFCDSYIIWMLYNNVDIQKCVQKR